VRARLGGYDRGVKHLPTVLLILSFPAGLLGYALGARIVSAVLPPDAGQGQGLIALFVPLFIAGLVMLPFLVPFFDRKAKQDLAAHAAETREAAGKGSGDTPGGEQG